MDLKGEFIYSLERNGRTVPYTVFSLGDRIAPGTHLAELLEEQGLFGPIQTFDYVSGVDTLPIQGTSLRGIDVYVFNHGGHFTPYEVDALNKKFGNTFTIKRGSDTAVTGLESMIGIYASWTMERMKKRYEDYHRLQNQHKNEVWANHIQGYTQARDAQRLHLTPRCQEQVRSAWQARIDDAIQQRDQGFPYMGVAGRYTSYRDPSWPEGEWKAIMLVGLNRNLIHMGANADYAFPYQRLTGYSIDSHNPNGRPEFYPNLYAPAQFLVWHELGHAVNPTEAGADQFGMQAMAAQGERIMRGDFSADFVIVDQQGNSIVRE